MARRLFYSGFMCLTFQLIACGALYGADAPTTRPFCAVTGKVTAPSEVPLSEMVVYLDSPDSNRVISAPPAAIKVSQKGAKFSPALVLVCVGQTVEFLNDEDHLIEHNVFSNAPPKRFDLGIFRPGESRSVLFDKPGAVFLYCSIHRYMDGVVYVSPTPYFSRVASDGTYAIEDAPPGIWVVKTWQRRRRFPELAIPLLLEPGKTVATNVELHKP